jgi:hypothetical protein
MYQNTNLRRYDNMKNGKYLSYINKPFVNKKVAPDYEDIITLKRE